MLPDDRLERKVEGMSDEAYRAAELLEEIVRNADPIDVVNRTMAEVIHDVRTSSKVGVTAYIRPSDHSVIVTYRIPTAVVAADSTKVVEWLKNWCDRSNQFLTFMALEMIRCSL